MKYMIFDTETSGLEAKDEITQFAGFLVNDDLKLERLYNFYCYPLVDISDKVVSITGLNKALLMELSGGKFFEEQFHELQYLQTCKDLTWVGYNVSFDTRMINQTLQNNGYEPFQFGRKVSLLNNQHGNYQFDVMMACANLYNHGKRANLAKAVRTYCKTEEQQIKAEYRRILEFAGIPMLGEYHNALFDAYSTFHLFKEVINFYRG